MSGSGGAGRGVLWYGSKTGVCWLVGRHAFDLGLNLVRPELSEDTLFCEQLGVTAGLCAQNSSKIDCNQTGGRTDDATSMNDENYVGAHDRRKAARRQLKKVS